MIKKPLRAWTYARVSTVDQVDGTSLDTQRQLCRDEVARRGWTLVEEISDEGISGAKSNRPGVDRIMAACRAGEVDAVVVAKMDRFGRSVRYLANAVGELDDLGVIFVSATEGAVDSSTEGTLMRTTLMGFAEWERKRILERTVGGLRAVAQAGYWTGGPAPYGYKIVPTEDGSSHKKLTINEDEAAVLRRVADLIVRHGETAYSVAPILNADGTRTRRGKMWRYRNLCWQLRQPHLTGTWVYNQGGEPIEVEIPPIFSQDEWDRLQANINGKPRPQRKNRTYALTGRGPHKHLHCSCGGGFFGKTDSSKKGRSYYQCSRDDKSFGDGRCPHRPRTIRTPDLDDLVWQEFVTKALDEEYLTRLASQYIPAVADETGESLASQRRSLENKLSKNRDSQKRLIRKMAEDDTLDILGDVVVDLREEEAAISAQLDELERRHALVAHRESIPDQIAAMVARAKERLANPTVELMSEVFYEHQLELTRVNDSRFEGTASIPLFGGAEGGEVREGGPRRSSRPL